MAGQRMIIRPYDKEDYETVKTWWDEANEVAPLNNMMPGDSSFILEWDGTPMLCCSLYLLNIKHIAWIDNFIGNPKMEGKRRRRCTKELLKFISHFAKIRGYKGLFCMGENEKIKQYYEKELGFTRTVDVTCFVKPFKGDE